MYNVQCITDVYCRYTVARYSLFLIAALSVARTRSLTRPLRPLHKYKVLVPVGVYLLLLLLQETFPYWHRVGAEFYPSLVSCAWFLSSIYPADSPDYFLAHLGHMVFVVAETAAPILVILAASLFSWGYLERRRRKRRDTFYKMTGSTTLRKSNDPSHESIPRALQHLGSGSPKHPSGIQAAQVQSRSASATIVLIAAACFTLNCPFLIMIFLSMVERFSHCELFCLVEYMDTRSFILVMFLIHTAAVELNSVINPLIYIVRMKRLRLFIVALFKCDREAAGG